MAVFNVQRGRDHGLPSYGSYRQFTGKNVPLQWSYLETDFFPSIIEILKDLYDSPADIDLWIGLIAEKPDNDQLLASTQRCKFVD
jgi:peroxidase